MSLKESFTWVDESGAALPIPKNQLIKLVSKTESTTYHPGDVQYPIRRFAGEELRRAARTLVGKPIGRNHESLPIRGAYVLDSEYDEVGSAVESIGYVPASWIDKIKTGKVNRCSVEYSWRKENRCEADNSCMFEGLIFTRVDLLEGIPPGDPNSAVQLFESTNKDPQAGIFIADILLESAGAGTDVSGSGSAIDNSNSNGRPAPGIEVAGPLSSWKKPDLGHATGHATGQQPLPGADSDANDSNMGEKTAMTDEEKKKIADAEMMNHGKEGGSGTGNPNKLPRSTMLPNPSPGAPDLQSNSTALDGGEHVNALPLKQTGTIVPVPTGQGQGMTDNNAYHNQPPVKVSAVIDGDLLMVEFHSLGEAVKRVKELTEAFKRIQNENVKLKEGRDAQVKIHVNNSIMDLRRRVESVLPNGGFIRDHKMNRLIGDVKKALHE